MGVVELAAALVSDSQVNTPLRDLNHLGPCSLHGVAGEIHKWLLIKQRLGAGCVVCEMVADASW